MNDDVNVMIVDDFEQNLLAMEAVITRPGIRVLKAASGTEALEQLLTEDIALALLDVQMPGMDGFELAELIRGRERTRNIPLIFLTAATRDPERVFRGYESGAVDFLFKPIEPNILRNKVDVFVELYAQRKLLSSQLEELRQALHINEIFTAVLGHDLRNPLSAIRYSAEAILRKSGDEKITAAATRIQTSGARMVRMINQLLDLARLRAGIISLKPQRADLHELCMAIRDEFERDAPERIAINVSGDTRAKFDIDRMSQVLSNLIGNAMQHGDPAQEVIVAVDGKDPDKLAVVISNGGVIPAQKLGSLFEPYKTNQSETEGLGLGMYIVDRFVRAHGGTVSAKSDELSGTAISFFIPRTEQQTL